MVSFGGVNPFPVDFDRPYPRPPIAEPVGAPQQPANDLTGLFEEDEEGRRALFYSQLPGGLRPLQQQAAFNLYQPTFARYLGELGKQVRAGSAPTLSFTDFLRGSFNTTRELLRLPGAEDTSAVTGRGARYFLQG